MPTTHNTNIGQIVLATAPIEALHKDVADAFEYARKHKVLLNQSDIAIVIRCIKSYQHVWFKDCTLLKRQRRK